MSVISVRLRPPLKYSATTVYNPPTPALALVFAENYTLRAVLIEETRDFLKPIGAIHQRKEKTLVLFFLTLPEALLVDAPRSTPPA